METEKIKILSLKAKCGSVERELTFPVPAEILEWLQRVELPTAENEGEAMRFNVEGSRKIQLTVTLLDLQRKF